MSKLQNKLSDLNNSLDGELFFDETYRTIYSTDASAYKEKPTAVAFPKNKTDIKKLIYFVKQNKLSLVPRGAGTSLAGQVTGNGIIVDVSKYMNKIIKIYPEKNIAIVQPGVILSELNKKLLKYKLQFGPETSSANRCTIGGMLGNNACGLHSLVHGSTREHTISIKTILSSEEEVEFKEINKQEFENKCKGDKLENKIYRNINKILSDKNIIEKIKKEYPDKNIPRRNTGYALDILSDNKIFNNNFFFNTERKNKFDIQTKVNIKNFNFSKLLAGSEGTLAFTTEITLNLVPLLPPEKALLVVHFSNLKHAFKANLIALKYNPTAIELSDKTILELTKNNISLQKNRFFIEGEPEAILIIEFAENQKEAITRKADNLETEMKKAGYGYAFPLIFGDNIQKVWNLRKAGLGVLSNMKGDAKPVSVTEDTAINTEKLPDYTAEFSQLIKSYGLTCVYHAHIATGELHLRPILNLKNEKDVILFRKLAKDTATLVKKYGGSLSGEHGDGRLRGEFLKLMYGEELYSVFEDIKQTWDKKNIFNPGKIIDTPAMNSNLRYIPGKETKNIETTFDFSAEDGIIRASEKCNGSADCRKSAIIGGTMCPTYMALKDEKFTPRARANMLREILSSAKNPFDNKELYQILDLCLSCKACKSECPAGVDITKLKAEFLQQYYENNTIPIRTKLIANITKINSFLSNFAGINNFFTQNNLFSKLILKIIGFSTKRKLPKLHRKTLKHYYKKLQQKKQNHINTYQNLYLFADEFINFNEPDIGIKTIILLNKLGYKVIIPDISESGRTYLSKGLVKKAKKIAEKNINLLKNIINKENLLIGIEPSAILTFRDEYLDFFNKNSENGKNALKISRNTFMIEEFIEKEIKAGRISKENFTKEKLNIKLHGHCQQKATASTEATKFILSFPENYNVEEIPSGCCGMAGAFGYEKEHYETSMKIGELVLFPAVRKTHKDTVIAANGTSCRCQIEDGTAKKALHPIEILFDAMIY